MGLLDDIFGADVDVIPGIGRDQGLTYEQLERQKAEDAKWAAYHQAKKDVEREQQQKTRNESEEAPVYDIGAAQAAAAVARDRAAASGQWEDQIDWINQQLKGLGGYEKSGKTQLMDAFNKGLSRLNQQQSNALSKYATQRNDTRGDFENVGSDIDSSARNNYSALMSLLGRAGAGSSSAAEVLTPYAVSQVASKSRGEAANTYGRNLRDLDTAETQTRESYNNNKRDLEDQKRTNEYNLMRSLGSQRQTLQGNLAEAQANLEMARGGDYNKAKAAAADAVGARNKTAQALATLLDQYRNPYTVKNVTVKNPTMTNYADSSEGVKVDDPNSEGYDTDTSAEYLQQIKDEEERKKKDEQAA